MYKTCADPSVGSRGEAGPPKITGSGDSFLLFDGYIDGITALTRAVRAVCCRRFNKVALKPDLIFGYLTGKRHFGYEPLYSMLTGGPAPLHVARVRKSVGERPLDTKEQRHRVLHGCAFSIVKALKRLRKP